MPDRARLLFPPGLQAYSSSPPLHLLSWLFLQLLEALGKDSQKMLSLGISEAIRLKAVLPVFVPPTLPASATPPTLWARHRAG